MISQIRFARSEDLTGVRRLYKELRPNDPALSPDDAAANWNNVLSQSHIRMVVAEQDGVLASTCMLAVIANFASGSRPLGLIEHVITLPQFRGRRLGHAVMQYALEFAWSQNCCKVMLLSGAQRGEAHRFYESLGFRGDVERGFVIKPTK